ncbi:MAG: T9SS type A sorting domain-containing protein [Bacteroidota bacterium]
MKKLTLFILGVVFSHSLAFSQACLPEGITFTTQEQIDNFQTNYPGCTEIEGDVTINGEDITNLNGLNVLTSIGGYFVIGIYTWPSGGGNPNLASLTGLDNLISIGGYLSISGNNALTSLTGLDDLCYIGGLIVTGNNSLLDLTGIDNLTLTGGSVRIGGNPVLTNLSALINLNYIPGNLELGTWYASGIHGNPSLTNLEGLDNLDSIGGSFDIFLNISLQDITALENLIKIGSDLRMGYWGGNPSLTSLAGMENLVSIGGSMEVRSNDSLINFEGMESLESIGGSLRLGRANDGSTSYGGNLSLINLTGLNNLNSIGGNLEIYFNPSLTSLTGLENLSTIGGDLMIGGHLWQAGGNETLVSLAALENLSCIGGKIGISFNDKLPSLSGLDNIAPGSISDLWILENPLLTFCEIQSICDYLVNPNGEVYIWSNAPGCNSPEEVEAACNEVSAESISLEDGFLLFPNPAGKTVTISDNSARAIREIYIYNQTGQKVLQSKLQNNTLNISKLKPGMYIVELVTDQGKVRKKLMVE